jgi:flagellar motor switch protein FliN/FliY
MANEVKLQGGNPTENEEPEWDDVGLGNPPDSELTGDVTEANNMKNGGKAGVGPADFSPLEGSKQTQPVGNIEMIMDIPVVLSVELGRTKMLINDLLQLGQGAIIELEKMAGEPMEILINEKLMARGEVVVVNEKFGIRLTDIISPMDRIKQLG